MLDSYDTPVPTSPSAAPRTTPASQDADAEADRRLACLVRQALADLARHSNAYARVLANRSAVRLAAHVRAGQVDRLSDEGRQAMSTVHQTIVAARAVEPGLDTNAFLGHLRRGSPRS